MPYIPNTDLDLQKILKDLGINSTDELFKTLPDSQNIFPNDILEKDSIPEQSVELKLKNLASKNKEYEPENIFLGAGSYYHYIPSAVDSILSRQEFYTAYTPYQPEVSQGTLRAIFEFQTAISELSGYPIVNASMYDGATASAEAILMAYRKYRGKKKTALISSTIHPEYIDVIKNYTEAYGIRLNFLDSEEYSLKLDTIKENYDEDTFVFIAQYPNFYGVLESELQSILDFFKEKELVKIAITVDASVLAIAKTPQNLGFDISVLEIQSFGNPVAFGGPHAGVIATNKDFVRTIPGRIVGKTEDKDGNEAFVLTLSTREQHIRREKATSNICTNQSLIALRSIVYLALMGQDNLKLLAENSYKNAHYLQSLLYKNGFKTNVKDNFYNEFVLEISEPKKLLEKMRQQNILAGYELDNGILIACTEFNTKESIENFLNNLLKIQ